MEVSVHFYCFCLRDLTHKPMDPFSIGPLVVVKCHKINWHTTSHICMNVRCVVIMCVRWQLSLPFLSCFSLYFTLPSFSLFLWFKITSKTFKSPHSHRPSLVGEPQRCIADPVMSEPFVTSRRKRGDADRTTVSSMWLPDCKRVLSFDTNPVNSLNLWAIISVRSTTTLTGRGVV